MYKVSVVTPFHNVDMGMFSKCASSMRSQTIGFENVEWIIVVHNSEPHYMPLLTQMFKDDKNVTVKELHDRFHSPATPRNCGMKSVTAPCVGFLDADDSYTPECLEVARREMMETGAQIVTFRREYELETESLHPHTEVVAWNQTQWRIVMDRKDFQLDKMFTGLWPFSTSRLFDVDFLRSNGIDFSEDVLWLEDVWHTAVCLVKAQRVCYLPQFIGYHYFINGGSIIQDSKKSMEDLYEGFKSAQLILDFMESAGLDTNDTAQTIYRLLTRSFLASDLTVEQRRQLSEMARPYLAKFSKITPSKIHSPEECYMSYHLSREVLSNPENPTESPALKEAVNGWLTLMEIMRNNSNTDYGRAYGFDGIETLADYQRQVPLADYKVYRPLINLQTNIGENDILTAEPTRYYLVNRKDERIPCTEKHMKPYAESFATTLKGHHNLLVAMVGPRSKQTNDGCTIETLESMMVKLYMWRFHYARGKRRADFSMPDRLFFKTEPHDEQHAICYYALLDRDIDQIVALNTRRVSDMFLYLKAHQDQLVAEIREADKDRAAEVVERALQSAEPLACALWPKLERIVAFGAGEYAEATALMKVFTGNTPHNHGYCYTEETICGRAVEDNSDLFETVQSDSFHEYMPAGGDNGTTLLSTDVKQGEAYQLVVTNSAGLYRFVTSHRLCIEDVQLDRTLFKIQ